MKKRNVIRTEVLVIGTGIAGCSAALKLAENGVRVLLITKDGDIKKSSTFLAQGGIIARGKADSAEKLAKDIIEAGDGLCDLAAVKLLSEEGPRLVENILINKLGVEFTREGGEFDYTKEAAHSVNRILHKEDRTGEEIEDKFVRAINDEKNIRVTKDMTLIELIVKGKGNRVKRMHAERLQCVGAKLFDNVSGEIVCVIADEVVLATGGVGQVYARTTNSRVATGDGLSAAWRAGAVITNAEYVQFHPTSLFVESEESFLISESVRGEGAKLVNERGELFMGKYDPRGSLAPRDIVARAICAEIAKSSGDCVYLDMKSCMKPDFIRKRFPLIYETCLGNGIDATNELIPVAPIAHYFCGGVRVDGWGRTNIARLYAAGEVSCTGVHGANRLASTSLLEGLVWGTRCAEDIINNRAKGRRPAKWSDIPDEEMHVSRNIGTEDICRDWLNIKKLMWEDVGIIRTDTGLERAVCELEELEERIEGEYRSARLSRAMIELRSGVTTALIIARAARNNRESRGCHYLDNSGAKINNHNVKIYGESFRRDIPAEERK
jgi:L-aspartate oxidase